ncbi:putative polyketide synthase [Xylaria digitata]|nr:putative polyketide synthase [Xylaria digitata]
MGQYFNGQVPTDALDPAYVVGIGCRLPGGIRSASELWDFLVQKKSAQGVVPKERFNIGGFYHPDGSRRAGTIDADGGYFLNEDIREFENDFFSINNLEAKYEVATECLENAGTPLEAISGTNTAVYTPNLHRYHPTGTVTAIMANRISHFFNLHGPSFTLDTACSSSLVCLHTAVAALQNGECDGAIVAGASLINGIEQHMATVKGGVISPTSTCHTFDAAADGYGRAEAVSAGPNPIRAVIRGTAINANGRTPGIILPSADLQEAVIRKAYRVAGISPADTDYVECHGTGTAVGDPIEIDGISRYFGLKSGHPLMIGAIKPNIGHSGAASALLAVIKVMLAFEHSNIPPTRSPRELNPKLPLESINMKIVTEPENWPRDIRRASINAFGFGGANAHVILESYDSYCGSMARKINLTVTHIRCGRHILLPYSAASSKALLRRREHVISAIQDHKSQTDGLQNLAYTLSKRRSHFKHRGFVLCDGGADVIGSEPTRGGGQPLRIAYICTGQGSQYPGMGKELLLYGPRIFADKIRSLDAVLQSLPAPLRPDWTLSAAMQSPNASDVHSVERSQPLCTAIRIAIIAMLQSWGVSPVATLGHSSGEIAAAYSAGLLAAEQAIFVAYSRGYAVKKLPMLGSMIAVGLLAEAAATLIAEKNLSGQLCVACVNSEENVTLSGDAGAIYSLFQDLQGELFARVLETNGRGYHSHLMREVGPLYQELLDKHVFAGWPTELVLSASEIEMPVQFNGAIQKLLAGRQLHLIKIRSHAALRSAVEQVRKKLGIEDTMPYDPTLLRGRNAEVCMKSLAGNLFTSGHALNWLAQNILKLEEIPWIRDHKVETHIVFPAAGHFSIAMEAMAQACNFNSLVPGAIFSFRNVNIITAFVIEKGASAQVAKLHATVALRKISTFIRSTIWYEFSISSWLEGVSTLHCSGSIRVDREDRNASLFSGVVAVDNSTGYKTMATEKCIKTNSSRIRTSFIAKTTLTQRQSQNPESKHPKTRYNVSPTVLDACIQAPIMGGTAGNINNLEAYLPIFISRCIVRAPDMDVDSTIYNSWGMPIIYFAEVRLARYRANTDSQTGELGESDLALQRHPCLRICWEPDVSRLEPEDELEIRRYLSRERLHLEDTPGFNGDAVLGVLLKLAGHRKPRMNILELSSKPSTYAADFSEVVGKDTAFSRCSSWNVGGLEEDGTIRISSGEMKQFDVVIHSEPVFTSSRKFLLHEIYPRIAPDGIFIIKFPDAKRETFQIDGFRQVIANPDWRLLIPSHDKHRFHGREFLILVNKPSDNLRAFSAYLTRYLTDTLEAASVNVVAQSELSSLHITRETACISLLEAEQKFLATMTTEEMDRLRSIILAVSDIAWITGSALFGEEEANPDLALVPGLSRTMMLEQPLLRPSALDVGRALERGVHSAVMAQSMCASIIKCMVSHDDRDDKEFVLVNSLLYISRFVPDAKMNELFGYHLGSQGQRKTRVKSLVEACPAQLCELCEPPMGPPPAGFVDVRLKAVGINAKDIYTMTGRIETRHGTLCNEISGVVEAIGPGVGGDISPGDRVAVPAPLHFRTTERVPEWTVYKMLSTESFSTMASLPVAYMTALYALEDCAHLKSGKTILIHARASAVRIAAITLAQHLGATIYTTVSSQQKRDFLPEGRGVDVVLNSLPGNLMHESWGCIANFGRFVEIGKREPLEAGKLDMRVFLRNVTFRAFDLSDLHYDDGGQHRSILIRDRIGKIVISLEDPSSQITVTPPSYKSVFSPDKAYLLIGCLGGLGRSLTRWMMARGAWYFPKAKSLISRIRAAGGMCTVVTGDVSNAADVAAAVSACRTLRPSIGGVVQAAMGLHEAIFSNTSLMHLRGSSASKAYHSVFVSLGMISDVGYLYENPGIEALLLRKGIQLLNEAEFLRIIDLAVFSATAKLQSQGDAHILTGLEPFGLRRLMTKGFEVDNDTFRDPRTALISAALIAEQEKRSVSGRGTYKPGMGENAPEWLKSVPEPISSVLLQSISSGEQVRDALLKLILKRFSDLVLLPLDQMDKKKPLSQYGMDSLIAAEFRAWFWRMLKVDVPFLTLLSPTKNLMMLASLAEVELVSKC